MKKIFMILKCHFDQREKSHKQKRFLISRLIRNDKHIQASQFNRHLIKSVILISMLSSLLIYSCGNENDNSSETVIAGTPVTITHPELTSMSDYIELNGSTVFLTKEIVRATFQGFIKNVYKNIGDSVKAGENLFQIKTMESEAADSLKISFGNKQFKGAINLKAQSNGILTELNYHQGDFISNGEQLAVISNPSSIRINVNVPFEQVSKIKIGNKCEIDLPGNKILLGVIDRNIPKVDSATQTQTYYIGLSKYESLPENLNVKVKISFNSGSNVLAIPKSSVITNVTQDSFWVMKLINDTTAVKNNIIKGIENGSFVQVINSDLKLNDRVVLSGAYGLPDSAKVEIVK